MTKQGDLRVWWIPQVPMNNPFNVEVESQFEAKKILDILANYDIFQFENKIKPDYSNVGGLEVFDGEEWVEWEDDEGNTIDDAKLCRNCQSMKDRNVEGQCVCGKIIGSVDEITTENLEHCKEDIDNLVDKL